MRSRFLFWLTGWLGSLLVRLIGCTLRYSISFEEGGPSNDRPGGAIYAFWHRCVLPAAYYFRGQNIAVMTSHSRDGEYVARIIQRLGYRPIRGSSSRGAVAAFLGMHRHLQQGLSIAFAIDGPRGPRYIAKPGPVLLARKTGMPLIGFHIALDRAWVLRSWDAFLIPKPFSRALIRASKMIPAPAGNDDADADLRCLTELQSALERIRTFAEAQVGQQH